MSFFFDPLERGAYNLVKIDPPWPWKTYTANGAKKSPSAHYREMPWPEIEGFPVVDLLAPGGVVFVYCTWPLFGRQSLIVDRCWGLDIITGGAWSKRTAAGKLRWGTGHVLRSVCEPFLIAGLKGHKLRGRSVKNLVETFGGAEVHGIAREHSRKPDEIYDTLENMTPGWRRADVFSRTRRENWEAFGDEASKFGRTA